MIATRELTFEFIHSIPVDLEAGRLYISTEFATAMHQCCCGCGNIVVTPLSPAFWTLIFDGSTVSLNPSIGNWNFPCRSHYFIDRNRVSWVPRWSEKQIALSRASATARRDALFGPASAMTEPSDGVSAWGRMKSWFRRK